MGGRLEQTHQHARLVLAPIDRDDAFAWISRVHRHHRPPQGYRFAIAAMLGTELVAVATAGRPVARLMCDGYTIEVTRVAADGTPNACSLLYAACWRAAKALGYTRATTYTHTSETGASLRAAGWQRVAELPARTGWDTPSRRRTTTPTAGIDRYRWQITTADHGQRPALTLPTRARSGQGGLFDHTQHEHAH